MDLVPETFILWILSQVLPAHEWSSQFERLGWNITGSITLHFEFINILFSSFLVTSGRTFTLIALMYEPDLSLSCRKHGQFHWLEIKNGWAGTSCSRNLKSLQHAMGDSFFWPPEGLIARSPCQYCSANVRCIGVAVKCVEERRKCFFLNRITAVVRSA